MAVQILRTASILFGISLLSWRRASFLVLLMPYALGIVHAQTVAWKPERSVEFVVGANPGGGNDITARSIQTILQTNKLVESIQVVNKPGGNHTIAWNYVNLHKADGHYIQIINEPLLTNKISGVSPLNHNDFTPLARLFNEYVLFVTQTGSSFTDGKNLVASLKKDGASVVIGFGAARGNSAHMGIGMLAKASGIDVSKMRVVVFDSGSKSITAAIGGHVNVTATVPASARQHLVGGKLRAIALTSDKRLGGDFADIPTWRELGVDAYYSSWRVLFGPKDLPAGQIAFWENALFKMSGTDEWKKNLGNFVQDSAFLVGADLRRFLAEQDKELRGLLVGFGMAKD